MKFRGKVVDIDDPQELARIKVQVYGYEVGGTVSPWCWPCTVLSGPGYGFFMLPVPGDEVYVEKIADGTWVWSGFHWSKRNTTPVGATANRRFLRTPSGHTLLFDEDGDIVIEHSTGNKITLEADGGIAIEASGDVTLNGDSGGGVVTKSCICAYTGLSHPEGSSTVKADGQ